MAAGPGGSVQRLPADHAGAAAGPAGHGGAVPAARLAAHVETPARGHAGLSRSPVSLHITSTDDGGSLLLQEIVPATGPKRHSG